jgi:hypothetical protein
MSNTVTSNSVNANFAEQTVRLFEKNRKFAAKPLQRSFGHCTRHTLKVMQSKV